MNPIDPADIIPHLQQIGLSPLLARQWLEDYPEHELWRVSAVNRGGCHLIGCPVDTAPSSSSNEWPVPLATCAALTPPELSLAVGDWAVVTAHRSGEPRRVVAHLERQTWLQRGRVGKRAEAQFIASNIDTTIVVCAFSTNPKLERRALGARAIERYVAAIEQGRSAPLVVLNKVDLSEHAAQWEDELKQRLQGVPIVALSAQQGTHLQKLEHLFVPGSTVALVGKSGVGKSTLINRLLGQQQQLTQEVRDADAKGKHTTTRREMFPGPCGALLIDTPGMRELSVIAAPGESLGFDDLDELEEQCRFHDCGHTNEPGCAVRQAIQEGTLSSERLSHQRQLAEETLRQSARHDAQARGAQRKAHKDRTKHIKDTLRARRRGDIS